MFLYGGLQICLFLFAYWILCAGRCPCGWLSIPSCGRHCGGDFRRAGADRSVCARSCANLRENLQRAVCSVPSINACAKWLIVSWLSMPTSLRPASRLELRAFSGCQTSDLGDSAIVAQSLAEFHSNAINVSRRRTVASDMVRSECGDILLMSIADVIGFRVRLYALASSDRTWDHHGIACQVRALKAA